MIESAIAQGCLEPGDLTLLSEEELMGLGLSLVLARKIRNYKAGAQGSTGLVPDDKKKRPHNTTETGKEYRQNEYLSEYRPGSEITIEEQPLASG